jgi:hypothetical protein
LQATLTVPGELLGTPPYMAPEQWNGGPITPATDQFAFCVALWEAITGERPYRGDRTAIRDQILRGPAELDTSRIPRRFRRLLGRGLDPDAARRWLTMEAVLAQLERAPLLRGTSIVVMACIAATAVVMLRNATHVEATVRPVATCTSDEHDVAILWRPAIAAKLREHVPEAEVDMLDAAFHRWEAAHERACLAPANLVVAQLLCLDGVLDRFEAVREAYALVPEEAVEELRAQLVDPDIRFKRMPADVPRLTMGATPAVIAAFALLARSETEHKPSDREIEAFRQSARELEALGRRDLRRRQLRAAVARNELRLVRSGPHDLEDGRGGSALGGDRRAGPPRRSRLGHRPASGRGGALARRSLRRCAMVAHGSQRSD